MKPRGWPKYWRPVRATKQAMELARLVSNPAFLDLLHRLAGVEDHD
jgi:hypothetical protein